MKFVEVLLLTKTGSGDTAFTYETDGNVKVGALVMIPLRNRKVKGMVLKQVEKPDFATKKIEKILADEAPLSENQLKLAEKIADYYFCSTCEVIPNMLPFDFGKKRRTLKLLQPTTYNLQPKLKLTTGQKTASQTILKAEPGSKHLLFGVTGSGKTEIYLQLIEEGLKKGKGSIVLIPEISLTPQAKERFEKRFGDLVAVWHSGLKETEKYDTWQKIKSGEKKVVLGARSAIFAPVTDLAYVIIDEEHETSYKQDQTPRYQTGQVAEWLAELSGAKLVLGSATPRVESFQKAKNGDPASTDSDGYNLLKMNKRIVQDTMPPVTIIDLRDEFKKGNKSIFSDALEEAIKETLEAKKQVMLFVNRRGASTFVVCRDCGLVLSCPNCEIPLTFHQEGPAGKLNCHHCGHSEQIPSVCPNCHSYAIRYFGLGTQKVEAEVKKLFPTAKVKRMDGDTTKKRGSHEEIYAGFEGGDFDILVGTQLIAKGWDLPNVTTVGVVSADTMLNLPDFRSAERTFDLLTQVSGRTGRGFHPGKVIVQTYNPENYAIVAAGRHDYEAFYAKEIREREKFDFPPFCSLIKLTYSSPVYEKAEKEAILLADKLNGVKNVQIFGPNPSFLPKLAGNHRWQIILKIPNIKNQAPNKFEIPNPYGEQTDSKSEILKVLKKNIKKGWTVDVDPENLL